MSSDISKMSDEFHDWLEKCPVQWSKKHGEAIYTFWEVESEEDLEKALDFKIKKWGMDE